MPSKLTISVTNRLHLQHPRRAGYAGAQGDPSRPAGAVGADGGAVEGGGRPGRHVRLAGRVLVPGAGGRVVLARRPPHALHPELVGVRVSQRRPHPRRRHVRQRHQLSRHQVAVQRRECCSGRRLARRRRHERPRRVEAPGIVARRRRGYGGSRGQARWCQGEERLMI